MRSSDGGDAVLSLSRLCSDISGVATKVGAFVSMACALFATVVADLFGEWNASLSVLLWLVVGDYITGLVASVIEGSGLNSRVGFKGIARKVAIFFLVLVAHKMDLAMQVKVTMDMVIYFYVTNELISLIENLGRMGVPVPKQLVNIIHVLKGKIE